MGGNVFSSGNQNLANGGIIRGQGSGTSDSITANVSNGEFITNAASTKRFRPVLEAINSGTPASNSMPTSSRTTAGGGAANGER